MTRSIGLVMLLVMPACGPASSNVDTPQPARAQDEQCPVGEQLEPLEVRQPDGSFVEASDAYVCGTSPLAVVQTAMNGLCSLPSCGGPPWALPCALVQEGTVETGYSCDVLAAP